VLTIRGDMKAEDVRQERNYLVREHRAGRFSRSLRLSETVDQDAVGATYEDGVLRLTLPKAERVKAHRVPIEAGDRKSVGGVRGSGQAARGSGKSGASGRTS
jgi:HSP20 family protein